MTTYTAIPNGDIDQDSPVNQTLMTLLRDNPIGMFEGATGAPRLEDAALGSTATAAGADWARNRIALHNYNEIGTYILAEYTVAGSINPGTVVPGSNLNPTNAGQISIGLALSGAWRCMGYVQSAVSAGQSTLWLRVA